MVDWLSTYNVESEFGNSMISFEQTLHSVRKWFRRTCSACCNKTCLFSCDKKPFNNKQNQIE